MRHALVAAVIAALMGTTACADDRPERPILKIRHVSVFAAASLTEAFEQIAREYEQAHPDTKIRLNFGASSTLAQQIVQDAPADVYAAAAPEPMRVVEGIAGREPVVFARNRLQIAVPNGNPAQVTGLSDFARQELRIALCDERVPCGTAAAAVFDAAGVTPRPDTLEQDVKATLTKVRLGEVDAALVYRTDVLSAGDEVDGIDFAGSDQVVNDYPVMALTDEGAEFANYLRTEPARRILREAGFELP